MNYKKIYVIYDTQDECFVSFNYKAAWTAEGRAKSAFTAHMRSSYAEQERYIVLPVNVEEVV